MPWWRPAAARPVDRDRQQEFIATCRGLGLRTVAGFLIGFPEDTDESVRRVRDYAARLGPTFANFNVVTPYPGTPMFETVRERLGWADFQPFHGLPAGRALRAPDGGADRVARAEVLSAVLLSLGVSLPQRPAVVAGAGEICLRAVSEVGFPWQRPGGGRTQFAAYCPVGAWRAVRPAPCPHPYVAGTCGRRAALSLPGMGPQQLIHRWENRVCRSVLGWAAAPNLAQCGSASSRAGGGRCPERRGALVELHRAEDEFEKFFDETFARLQSLTLELVQRQQGSQAGGRLQADELRGVADCRRQFRVCLEELQEVQADARDAREETRRVWADVRAAQEQRCGRIHATRRGACRAAGGARASAIALGGRVPRAKQPVGRQHRRRRPSTANLRTHRRR